MWSAVAKCLEIPGSQLLAVVSNWGISVHVLIVEWLNAFTRSRNDIRLTRSGWGVNTGQSQGLYKALYKHYILPFKLALLTIWTILLMVDAVS